ncbi:Uncharacterised protein [Acinetobacter baumannii]|uniref:hypothetical protein n=1 Tax=Acinetobacter baumannii TaxID=470 RepID=UPI000DE6508E|nr:hypothetical protein [Acinetobacter baumannii]SSO58104.1 Uncharacterised protein [Acinetobacter baumannii]
MTLSEIKFRLITIAEKRKRPYFDMIVVREVYEAFKNNTYHELKNYVLAEMEVSVFEHGGVGQMNYKEMMALRCAYNHGLKTTETRAAANLYEKLRKLKMLDKLKQEAMTRRYKEAV